MTGPTTAPTTEVAVVVVGRTTAPTTARAAVAVAPMMATAIRPTTASMMGPTMIRAAAGVVGPMTTPTTSARRPIPTTRTADRPAPPIAAPPAEVAPVAGRPLGGPDSCRAALDPRRAPALRGTIGRREALAAASSPACRTRGSSHARRSTRTADRRRHGRSRHVPGDRRRRIVIGADAPAAPRAPDRPPPFLSGGPGTSGPSRPSRAKPV